MLVLYRQYRCTQQHQFTHLLAGLQVIESFQGEAIEDPAKDPQITALQQVKMKIEAKGEPLLPLSITRR